MGLDITVYKITKEETKYYFSLIDDDLNYCNNFPEWTKEYETEIEETFDDWDEYKERTGIDVYDYHISMICGDFMECYHKDDESNVLKINFNDVKEKKVKIKVLYREEVGYQRKGFNTQFYNDYDDGKIGYFVWNKEELMRYKTDYANEPEAFQGNIIDNFEENCVCTFDW